MQESLETRLARRLMEGDASAFDPFVDHFQAKLFQYSFLMCGHREDAEEVAQETLLKAFHSFQQLREPEHVKAWIFRIAKNFCHMKRRRSVYAPERELSLDELMPARAGEGQIEIADWSQLPDASVLQTEMRETLRDAIAGLPEMYRAVLLLRDVEGLSGAETAAVLDVSVDVVKQRLHRARLAVRQKLDSYLRRAEAPARP